MNKEPTESMTELATMIANRRIEELETEKEKLEKALDKACNVLSSEETEVYMTDEENNGADGTTPVLVQVKRSESEWKEWCLKDE